MLACAMALYQFAEPFLIIVNMMTSVFVIAFYLLVTEKLTFYLWKFCTEYPDLKEKIIQERYNRRKM